LASPLILIADDHDDEREASRQLLQREGWRTAAAASGPECLALAEQLAPAAIVLDFSLPGLDGWEVTKRLKATPKTASIPVIALTGHDTGEARDRAVRAGVSGYLVKPCHPDDLIDEVRRQAPKT
jgi:two-component system, cell cycle response regulator DivK